MEEEFSGGTFGRSVGRKKLGTREELWACLKMVKPGIAFTEQPSSRRERERGRVDHFCSKSSHAERLASKVLCFAFADCHAPYRLDRGCGGSALALYSGVQ